MATKQNPAVAVAKELGSLSSRSDHEARLEALALDAHEIDVLAELSISSLTKGTLPPELPTLTGLRTLEVKSCKLVALAAGTLPPSLTSLSLEFQSFKTTPDAVFEVATLEDLSLEDNAISSDVGAWDRLTALRTLSFASNKLRAIPNLLASQRVRRLARLNLIRNPVDVSQATRDALVGVEILPGRASQRLCATWHRASQRTTVAATRAGTSIQ